MASSKPHIILLPYPAQGHIPPLIHLSKLLAAQGATVTLVNVDSIHHKLLQLWSCPPGLDIQLRGITFPYDIPYGYDSSSHTEPLDFAQALQAMQATFEEFVLQHQPSVSCIVADYLFGWHLKVAKHFGIRGVSYWPGSATWSTVHHHLPLMLSAGDIPIEEGDDRIISYVPGVSPTKLTHFPYYAGVKYKSTLECLIQAHEKAMEYLDKQAWFLINSTEELEPDAFKAMKNIIGNRCIGVGPLFPLNLETAGNVHSLREEDRDCITWLDTQAPKSVLYVSFGSIATLPKNEFSELAKGLVESQSPFLWVVRPEQKEEVEILEGVLLEARDVRGRIVSWAPQMRVLSHPSVGGFLSHCGWNSVFEALAHGVPILGWPCVVEQNLNCKLLVQDLEAGMEVLTKEKGEITKLIQALMDKDSLLRAKAEEISELVRGAAIEHGSSYESVKLFIKEISS